MGFFKKIEKKYLAYGRKKGFLVSAKHARQIDESQRMDGDRPLTEKEQKKSFGKVYVKKKTRRKTKKPRR